MNPQDFPWLVELQQKQNKEAEQEHKTNSEFKTWFKTQTGRDMVCQIGGGRRTHYTSPVFLDDQNQSWTLLYFPWRRLVKTEPRNKIFMST